VSSPNTAVPIIGADRSFNDQFGRTRQYVSFNSRRGWVNVCTYGTCLRKVAWNECRKQNIRTGPKLTGFNMCKKHEGTQQVSSVQQGLSRYFSS
jgi:hypothetical protein